MQRSHAHRVSFTTSTSPKSVATRNSSVTTNGCGAPTEGDSCQMCGGGRCWTWGCRSICKGRAVSKPRKDHVTNILPHAWHARRTPSCPRRGPVPERSAIRQNQWPYMRDMLVETSLSPQPLQGRDRMFFVKIYVHVFINHREIISRVRFTYEGIIAEIRRMSVQALVGTRENGLRKMRSSREDGSTVR
jgi:hypothetical protein